MNKCYEIKYLSLSQPVEKLLLTSWFLDRRKIWDAPETSHANVCKFLNIFPTVSLFKIWVADWGKKDTPFGSKSHLMMSFVNDF
jgi:hypothetical protein